MRKAAVVGVLAILAGAGAARACEGQTGAVVFEDSFPDDSGGWDLTAPGSTIVPPALVLSVGKTFANYGAQNLTFNAIDADYCTEAVMGKPPAADINIASGLVFLAQDYANYYDLMVKANGLIGFYKLTASKWSTIFEVPNSPLVKTAPDSVNVLRAVVKDGKLALSVNGTVVKTVRAQIPTGNLRFGVYGEVGKLVPDDVALRFKSYKVTAAQ